MVGTDKASSEGKRRSVRASNLLRDLWTGLLDLAYPPKCLVCGEMQPKFLCDACLAEVVLIEPPVCSQCGAPLQEGRCPECRHEVEFAFNSARAVGQYDGVLKEAIHQLKYSGHRVLGPVLGALIVEHLRRSALVPRVACIVPMPIHPSRVRQRGFNQSELLAAEVSRAFGLPLLPRALVRTRPTRPQVDLPIEKRRENVEGAFKVVREDAVAGRSILLVDDVLTTGSTADSAARALRDAGAREIHVLTLARSL